MSIDDTKRKSGKWQSAGQHRIGAPIEQLDRLLEAKTLGIARLMEIAPKGAVDSTPSLYNTTMYTMAALLVVAFFANLLMRPVSERHHYRG